MRVTLKAAALNNADAFHIDMLDLYNSRSRELFTEACQKNFKLKAADVSEDLQELIAALEQERIMVRLQGQKQQVADAGRTE